MKSINVKRTHYWVLFGGLRQVVLVRAVVLGLVAITHTI